MKIIHDMAITAANGDVITRNGIEAEYQNGEERALLALSEIQQLRGVTYMEAEKIFDIMQKDGVNHPEQKVFWPRDFPSESDGLAMDRDARQTAEMMGYEPSHFIEYV